jgi:hypothetical protein
MRLRKGGGRDAQSRRLPPDAAITKPDETDRPDFRALQRPNRGPAPGRRIGAGRAGVRRLESPPKSPGDGVDAPEDGANSVDLRH